MRKSNHRHIPFMMECLRLARKGEGYVSPNPMVGAVLVKSGRIVSRGYHKRFGGPHAEVDCLGNYDGSLRGATLYVNLEPCSYFGKTPPCTELLIRAGIQEVVVAMNDPNPLVAGRGIRRLRQAGIRVVEGVLRQEAEQFNRKFTRLITSGLPYVHLKIAQTLDGKIGVPHGKTRWITSKESRRLVHEWRREYDAILVGAGTIRSDDPLLTVRMVAGRNPDVVILDGNLSIKTSAGIVKHTTGRRIFVCSDAGVIRRQNWKVEQLEKRGIEVLSFKSVKGVIRLNAVLKELARHRIGSILVEGGSAVFTQFMREGIVDLLSVFVSPSILGDGVPAFGSIKNQEVSRLSRQGHKTVVQNVGSDVLIQTYFK